MRGTGKTNKEKNRMTRINNSIIAQGEGIINDSGNVSISRKYKGMKVIWVIPKDQGSDSIPKSHETP